MSEENRADAKIREETPAAPEETGGLAGRHPAKDGGKKKIRRGASWRLPILYALPFVLAVLAFILLLGDQIMDLIRVAIKLVVKA